MKLLDLPPEPWRNGGGVTRTVARDEDASGELWRVSAAEITASGAFSRFPNMDRQAVLIAGGPLTLIVACTPKTMAQVGDTVRFSGDADSAVTLSGRPARFWNVMTRRDRASAGVSLLRHTHGPLRIAEASAKSRHIVLVLAGACRSESQHAVEHHEAGALLVLQTPGQPCLICPDSPDTLLLHTAITL